MPDSFPESKPGRACGAGPCPAGSSKRRFPLDVAPLGSTTAAGHGPAPLGPISQKWKTINGHYARVPALHRLVYWSGNHSIMPLTSTDWIVIAGYLLINLLISIYYRRRAGGNTEEFFISGRNVSWWLAGTSMVATTFAADTPLLVTGLVARQGIAGNWLWWGQCLGGHVNGILLRALLAARGDPDRRGAG